MRVSVFKLLKRASAVLVVVLLIFAYLVLWVSNTQSGLRWALSLAKEQVNAHDINGTLSNAQFKKLNVEANGTQVYIETLSLSWSPWALVDKDIKVDRLEASGVVVSLESTDNPQPYQGFKGIDLPFNVKLNDVSLSDISVHSGSDQESKISSLKVSGSIMKNIADFKSNVVISTNSSVSLNGQIGLDAKPDSKLALDYQFQLSDNDNSGDDLIEGAGSLSGTWRESLLEHQQLQPLNASLNATLTDLASSEVSWQATLEAQKEKNTQGENQFTFKQTDLVIEEAKFYSDGSVDIAKGIAGLNANINGTAQLQASLDKDQSVAPFEININALAKANSVIIHKLDLQQGDSDMPVSSANLSGEIVGLNQNFLESSSGTMDLNGSWKSIRWPIVSAPDNTNSSLNSSGEFRVIKGDSEIRIAADSKGDYLGSDYAAELQAVIDGKTWEIEKLSTVVGQNSIRVNGKVDQIMDLDWNVSAPKLSDFSPNLSGNLNGSGQLSGTQNEPIVSGKFAGKDIVAGGVKINALALTVQTADRMQRLNLDINSDEVSDVALEMYGKWDSNAWSGKLTKLSWLPESSLPFELAQPAEIALGASGAKLEESCLQNKSQSLCTQISYEQGNLNSDIKLQDVQLSILDQYLSPQGLAMEGEINGDLNLVVSGTEKIEFEAKLKTTQAALLLDGKQWSANQASVQNSAQNLPVRRIEIDAFNLEAKQKDQLSVKFDAGIERVNRASMSLQSEAGIGDRNFNDSALSGTGSLILPDLAILPTDVELISNLKGRLESQVKISGTPASPQLSLKSELQGASVDVRDLGLSLKDIEFKAESLADQKIKLSGSLNSGDSPLTLKGELDFATLENPRASLNIIGSNVLLMNTPEVNLRATLDTKLRFANRAIAFTGSADVDYADINYQASASAVSVSKDVVLAGQEKQAESEITQRVNLSVDLGDQTQIQAQGLTGGLTGKLTLLKAYDGPVRALGHIDLLNGRYKAYGQDLAIEQGELIFAGNIVSNPSLNIRAQRKADDYTAGVSVIGTAAMPLLNLYSTPALSDQNTLSVIVFGKPLEDLGVQDTLTLLRIANSLRGDGTKPGVVENITSSMQETLGLTDLELKLSGSEPTIQAGKQLTSRFYVGYGYGLLDAAQSLVLKYKINNAWSIRGDVGANSSADLKYEVQR